MNEKGSGAPAAGSPEEERPGAKDLLNLRAVARERRKEHAVALQAVEDADAALAAAHAVEERAFGEWIKAKGALQAAAARFIADDDPPGLPTSDDTAGGPQ